MKDDDGIAARWEHPGMRLQLQYRGDELWCIEETAYDTFMLLIEEYYKTTRYCMEHSLPLPQPPDELAFQDKTIVAIRIGESFVRMLTPAEIAPRSRNEPMSDECFSSTGAAAGETR